jgi:hypothetical protein
MSFGNSTGEIVALGQLAWKVYKSCKDAPESFKNISQEALSLHALLLELGENLPAQTLSSTRQARLKTIGDGCRSVLEELQSLVHKYESLGTQSKRTWDRVKWGYNDIADLRSRLSSNVLLLTAFIRYGPYLMSTKYRVTSMRRNEYTNIKTARLKLSSRKNLTSFCRISKTENTRVRPSQLRQ